MLQVKRIREEKKAIIRGLRKRNWTSEQIKILDEILHTDDERRRLQKQLDDLLAENKRLSAQIGQLMAQGKREEAEQLKSKVTAQKEDVRQLEERFEEVKNRLESCSIQCLIALIAPSLQGEALRTTK